MTETDVTYHRADYEATIAQLREALEPFASVAAACAGEDDRLKVYIDITSPSIDWITVGDFRRAAAALGKQV